ncbi:MAG TPA: serine hydrolase domain-containing protein [Caulobacteraceae bacterium]|jgi:CubicO group peptidase (beta-lactamase class C family)|nr:serine hydrolase domain-containing protein [Caulobacteraceae bacterium]
MTSAKPRLKRLIALAAVAAAWLCASSSPAQTGPAQLDPAAVQRWADSFFQTTMAGSHVPGAVVVVVDHGKIVFMKGYGVTTPVAGHPIDPQTTLFRLGSITKVLTAITATQLIEEGRIDPASDVNRYLKRIQIPATYPQPVTVTELLAHEGGFGADLRGVDAPTNAEADISPARMQRLLVPRVRPPGRYIAYDNNGWGVLGLTLADATGTSYADLVRQRVFQPLGMTHSTIGIPDQDAGRAIGEHYVLPDGRVRRIDHSLLRPMEQGAGDASATGADMARLMIALLQGGQIDGQRVLSPAGYAAVTDFDAHRLHPMLPGYGRALYEDRPLGHFAIRHDGGMAGSAASMELYPREQIGVFFAVNARPYNPFDGETLTGLLRGVRMFLFDPKPKVSMAEFLPFLKIHESFARTFLPAAPPQPIDTRGVRTLTDADIAALAGKYVPTNSRFASFVGNLQVGLIEGVQVQPAGHGAVNIGGQVYRQIEPGLFEDSKTNNRMAFHTDAYGQFMGPAALWIDKRAAWYETPLLTIAPLVVLPLLLVLTGFYGFSARPLYRRLGLSAAVLGALYLVGLVLEAQYANQVLMIDQGWIAHLWRLPLQLVLVGLCLWPLALAWGWRTAPPKLTVRGLAAAVDLGLIAVASWALVALAAYWKLLGLI